MCSFWEKIHSFHPHSFTRHTGISHVQFPFALPALQPQELPPSHPKTGGNHLPQMSVCYQFKYHRGFFPPQCPFFLSCKTPLLVKKSMNRKVLTQSHQLQVWRNRKTAISFSFMDIKKSFPLFIIGKCKEGEE